MAIIRVRSTDGNDADNGTTWALAKATLQAAITASANGDSIWLSQVHDDNTTGAVTFTVKGTAALPAQLLCINDATDQLTTGAVVRGNDAITMGGLFSCYGIKFRPGEGSGASRAITLSITSNLFQKYTTCAFELASTGAGSAIICGGTNITTSFKNCTFKFASTGQGFNIGSSSRMNIDSCSIDGAGSAITTLVRDTTGNAASGFINGFDLTNAASTLNLMATAYPGNSLIFNGCKMPASWSGGLFAGSKPLTIKAILALYNSDNADTNYQLWLEAFAGAIRNDTAFTASATDGTTLISWKFKTNVDADDLQSLSSDSLILWNEATGSAKTVTVEFIHDSATALTDADIGMKVLYLGTSGVPLITVIDTEPLPLVTPTDLASSSATWTNPLTTNTGTITTTTISTAVTGVSTLFTTQLYVGAKIYNSSDTLIGTISSITNDTAAVLTANALVAVTAGAYKWGMGNQNKQKITASITPQEKGIVSVIINMHKASYTVYVNPEFTLT